MQYDRQELALFSDDQSIVQTPLVENSPFPHQMEVLVFSYIKLSRMSSNFSILFLHFLFCLINCLFLSQYHTVVIILSLECFEKYHGVQSPSNMAIPLLQAHTWYKICFSNSRRPSPLVSPTLVALYAVPYPGRTSLLIPTRNDCCSLQGAFKSHPV